MNTEKLYIPKIVITGGPCAGKTTAMTFLAQKLSTIGYYPVIVPEAPTILINAGITPVGGVFPIKAFQEQVIDLTLHMEASFERAVSILGHPKPILICDRGLMDPLAYMPEEMFWEIMSDRGLDHSSIRDARYLGAFHLRTAAFGAEDYYTLANNTARMEATLEEARRADERTLSAWVGHPHVSIIDNEGKNFEQKLGVLWKKMCRVLGEPVPLEIERKFLVRPVDPALMKIPHQVVDIEQIYIHSGEKGVVRRIRKRSQHGASTYFETTKRAVSPLVRIETEHFITKDAYADLRTHKEEHTIVLRKKRHCFVYGNQYFELDVFDAPHDGLYLLELELTEAQDVADLPLWIEVIREVTDDGAYSNYALAHV